MFTVGTNIQAQCEFFSASVANWVDRSIRGVCCLYLPWRLVGEDLSNVSLVIPM
jgi:hypothetical protein